MEAWRVWFAIFDNTAKGLCQLSAAIFYIFADINGAEVSPAAAFCQIAVPNLEKFRLIGGE
jgi:hypothetical protein